MELLLFLFFFILGFSLLTLIGYYYVLLFCSGKDSFEREELTNLQEIFPKEALRNFESENDLQNGLIAFVISIFFTYLWTFLGAILGVSSYSDEFTTYFFHSCFIPLVFFYGAPLLEDYFAGTIGSNHFATLLSGQTTAFVTGSVSTVIAATLTIYGSHHEALFFLVFINIASSGFVYVYRRREKALDNRVEDSSTDEEFSEEETDNEEIGV